MNSEDPNQMCSNSSKSSKKQKQKKIPQRGLGVEKLEKIRIEEQVANGFYPYPHIIPPTNSSSLPVPYLNYPPSQSPPSVISSPQNSILRPMIPNVENYYLNSVSSPHLIHPNGGGFDTKWPSVPTLDGNGHLHKMCYPYEVINQGLPLRPNVSLPFASNPIMPPSYIMQRPPQFSQASQASASSLMNIPLMNSPVISPFQMEPPSNQSSYSNISSLWSEEDRIATIKRRSPLLLDMPTFQSKLARIGSTSDESNPFGNGSVFNGDYPVPIFRDNPLTPSSSTSEPTTKKCKKGNGGDFLTLAPPSVTSPHPSPTLRHSLSHKRIGEEPVANPLRSAGLNHRYAENPSVNQGQRSFFSFFPASNVQQESSGTNNHSNSDGTGEVGGTIDLNLKL